MQVVLLTREYPPEVYGGAGVHVEYLSRELARLTSIEVRCFGAAREASEGSPTVRAFSSWEALGGESSYLQVRQAGDVTVVSLLVRRLTMDYSGAIGEMNHEEAPWQRRPNVGGRTSRRYAGAQALDGRGCRPRAARPTA